MKPKTDGIKVQFFIIEPLYKVQNKTIKDESGNKVRLEREKFIKEEYMKAWFYKRDISPYREYVGTKGKIATSRCNIHDSSTNKWYTVAHSLDEVHQAVQEVGERIGFK